MPFFASVTTTQTCCRFFVRASFRESRKVGRDRERAEKNVGWAETGLSATGTINFCRAVSGMSNIDFDLVT